VAVLSTIPDKTADIPIPITWIFLQRESNLRLAQQVINSGVDQISALKAR